LIALLLRLRDLNRRLMQKQFLSKKAAVFYEHVKLMLVMVPFPGSR
jgi:hypothetical protein